MSTTEESKQIPMEWETVQKLRGVTAVARRIGYSHTHLIRVMRGERKASPKLKAKLHRLGIPLPEITTQESN